MTALASARRLGGGRAALLAIAPVLAAFVINNAATFPNLAWYAALRKPWFTPPDWLFGPAWTVLGVLMTIAFHRILVRPAEHAGRRPAIAAFLVQMACNAGWSWAFFGAHSPAAGLAVIAAMIVAIGATMVLFARVDRLAGALLAPYLAWVCFAAALNGAVLALNPGA